VSYHVTWSPAAHKHFRKLDNRARKQVGLVVDKLAENPRPAGVKTVISLPGVLRARTGDYRVLYKIDEEKREVWIEDVRHRSKAYGGH
jgi:mRNA interferase RelE/StbE